MKQRVPLSSIISLWALGKTNTWEAMPNLGIADQRLMFYHANEYATCLLVLVLPSPHRPIMEESGTRCFMC